MKFRFILLAAVLETALALDAITPQRKDEELCADCPAECFPWCVNLNNVTKSPCESALDSNLPWQCRGLKCVNHYCGVAAAIFCTPDGKIDDLCFPPALPRGMKDENCRMWLESKCKDEPATATPVKTSSEPQMLMPTAHNNYEKCQGCPSECGELCMTAISESPCAVHPSSIEPSSTQCSAINCRDSFCYIPHSYFCTEDNEIDRNCTDFEISSMFLNSPNPVCKNWYLNQCKSQPQPDSGLDVPSNSAEKLASDIHPDDMCVPDCPSACGDFCRKPLNPPRHSECSVIRQANLQACGLRRCRDIKCQTHIPLFCHPFNAIDFRCTLRTNSSIFSSLNSECQLWLFGLCGSPESKVPQPKPKSTPAPAIRKCRDDCPDECGELCQQTYAIADPCMFSKCPSRSCESSFCGIPSALICDENGGIDIECSGPGVTQFLKKSSVCANWIRSRCPAKRKRREVDFQACKDDCPVVDCGFDLCQQVEAFRAPCHEGLTQQCSSNNLKTTCVDLYCGSPFPLFCHSNGSMDVSCTAKEAGARLFLGSENANCTNWFKRQCLVARQKTQPPNVFERPSMQIPLWALPRAPVGQWGMQNTFMGYWPFI